MWTPRIIIKFAPEMTMPEKIVKQRLLRKIKSLHQKLEKNKLFNELVSGEFEEEPLIEPDEALRYKGFDGEDT
jgi:hypothetical protein